MLEMHSLITSRVSASVNFFLAVSPTESLRKSWKMASSLQTSIRCCAATHIANVLTFRIAWGMRLYHGTVWKSIPFSTAPRPTLSTPPYAFVCATCAGKLGITAGPPFNRRVVVVPVGKEPARNAAIRAWCRGTKATDGPNHRRECYTALVK